MALAVAILTPLVAIPLTTTSPALAAATPNDAAGIVYPVTSFLDWAENPINNVTNPATGEYALSQILGQAQAAVHTENPSELNEANLLGPNGPADAEAFSEQMASQLIHLRPRIANEDLTDVANPNFLPDFDHNGVYGDPGDYTVTTENPPASGYFLYPCIALSSAVTYETANGTCAAGGTPGDTFKQGLAQQETIINSRGLTLAATLWLPSQALKSGCPTANPNASLCTPDHGLAPKSALDNGKGLPAVVIAEGIASSQNDYYWLAMTLARAGYIVLTYDPAGQGASEGSVANLFTPAIPSCEFGGACRDLQDVMRWLVGDPITPVVNLATANPLFSVAASPPPDASTAAAPTSPAIHNPALRARRLQRRRSRGRAHKYAEAGCGRPLHGRVEHAQLPLVPGPWQRRRRRQAAAPAGHRHRALRRGADDRSGADPVPDLRLRWVTDPPRSRRWRGRSRR